MSRKWQSFASKAFTFPLHVYWWHCSLETNIHHLNFRTHIRSFYCSGLSALRRWILYCNSETYTLKIVPTSHLQTGNLSSPTLPHAYFLLFSLWVDPWVAHELKIKHFIVRNVSLKFLWVLNKTDIFSSSLEMMQLACSRSVMFQLNVTHENTEDYLFSGEKSAKWQVTRQSRPLRFQTGPRLPISFCILWWGGACWIHWLLA